MFNKIAVIRNNNYVILHSDNNYSIVHYPDGLNTNGILLFANLNKDQCITIYKGLVNKYASEAKEFDVIVSLFEADDLTEAQKLVLDNLHIESKESGFGIIRFNMEGLDDYTTRQRVQDLFNEFNINTRAISVHELNG